MTEAEKLHQRAATFREVARRMRATARQATGSVRADLLHNATILMREAGVTLRRARRLARSDRHGGPAS